MQYIISLQPNVVYVGTYGQLHYQVSSSIPLQSSLGPTEKLIPNSNSRARLSGHLQKAFPNLS